jgi:hypothetical protein
MKDEFEKKLNRYDTSSTKFDLKIVCLFGFWTLS